MHLATKNFFFSQLAANQGIHLVKIEYTIYGHRGESFLTRFTTDLTRFS